MATPAQIAANRRNAQKSTGPKTKKGKAVSSQNARQHGLSSRSFRLEDLVSKRLVELQFRSLKEEHPPQTAEQVAALQELALRLRLSDELFALDLKVFNIVTRLQKGIRPTVFALSRVAELSHDNTDRIYSIYKENADLFAQKGQTQATNPIGAEN